MKLATLLTALMTVLMLATPALAQNTSQAPQDKLDELVRLLHDPEVQSLLAERQETAARSPETTSKDVISDWETQTRRRVDSVVSAFPRIPSEVAAAAMRTRQDALSHGYAPVFLIFAGLIVAGGLAERIYLGVVRASDRRVLALVPVLVFALAMAAIFFAIEWPPLARIVLLVYLTAFVVYRVGSVLCAMTLPKAFLARVRLFLAVACFAVASAALGPALGVDPAVTAAISYGFSFVLLCVVVEAAFRTTSSSRLRWLLVGTLVALWLAWCVGFRTIFWIGVYAIVLPPVLRHVGFTVSTLFRDDRPIRRVLVARGARALVVAIAMTWLALVWRENPDALGHANPLVTAVFYGLLRSVVVLLLADLVWQLVRNWIDGVLAASTVAPDAAPADAARHARYRTLLPILRNGLAAFVIVFTGLVVLAELGIEIGPLIAGASIFGVALGFGSQTLVKDVISGVFYMLDDAFRVGEYIQAKSYKGTVEGFSLRSVRLRHHRGPVYTIPFGELGAVQNMSRDWGVLKFRISVSYDTDIEKARKLTKKIGAALMEDPELGPIFIEPLKMKGVEEFGDYGIVLSFGMTLRPSPLQSLIRRRANFLIREGFVANGIEFAQPTVNVGGDDKTAGGAAAIAARVQQARTAEPEA